MKAWVLVGVVLVGVAEGEGSLRAWLRQIRSNDHQDSVSSSSVYPPHPAIQYSKTDTDTSGSNTDTRTSSVAGHTSLESGSNLQDLNYRPDEGVGPREDKDFGRRTRRSDMGSYGNTGVDKNQHIYSILALVVFASFLSYVVYHLVSNYKEEARALQMQDDVLANLLQAVVVGVGKWSLLQYLSEGVEDFDILHLWN